MFGEHLLQAFAKVLLFEVQWSSRNERGKSKLQEDESLPRYGQCFLLVEGNFLQSVRRATQI